MDRVGGALPLMTDAMAGARIPTFRRTEPYVDQRYTMQDMIRI